MKMLMLKRMYQIKSELQEDRYIQLFCEHYKGIHRVHFLKGNQRQYKYTLS